MLTQAMQNTFDQFSQKMERESEEFDKKLALDREQFYKRLDLDERRIEQNAQNLVNEMRDGRRWITGVIVASSLALAGYLSALIHFTAH